MTGLSNRICVELIKNYFIRITYCCIFKLDCIIVTLFFRGCKAQLEVTEVKARVQIITIWKIVIDADNFP